VNSSVLTRLAVTIQPIPLSSTERSAPVARYGAVLGTVKEGFVLLGGSAGTVDNVAWYFNATSAAWRQVITSLSSFNLQLKTTFDVVGACAVQNGDDLYIYGGSHNTPNTDLYHYVISKDTLTNMNVTGVCSFVLLNIHIFSTRLPVACPVVSETIPYTCLGVKPLLVVHFPFISMI
jgi:hypothetical protein